MHFRLQTIRTKLILTFCLMACLTLIVGLVGIYNISQLQELDSELYQHETLPLLELRIINGCFEQNRVYMRDILIEENPNKVSAYLQAIDENSQKIDQSLQKFAKSLRTNEERKAFEFFSNVLENFSYHRKQVIELYNNGNKPLAMKALLNDGPKLSSNLAKAIDRLSKIKEETGKKTAQNNKERAQMSMIYTCLLIAAAILLAIALGSYFTIKMIKKPLSELQKLMSRAGSGDLSVVGKIKSKDEIGELIETFNAMISKQSLVVSGVIKTADVLAKASQTMAESIEHITATSTEVAQSIQTVAHGAERGNEAVSEASQALHQLSSLIQLANQQSHSALQNTDITMKAATEGKHTVTMVVDKMTRIKEQTFETEAQMEKLNEYSSQIGLITETITNLSKQTNLLALNAAIEAARAGDAGRGFAVVAEEVRKLAEQSSSRASQVAVLVRKITESTLAAVNATHVSKIEVESGVGVAAGAGQALERIFETVQETHKGVTSVTSITEKEVESSKKVVSLIHEMASVVETTAASAQEVAASTEETSAIMQTIDASAQQATTMAHDLRSMASAFTV
mgnify:CR=1 FL=1